MRSLSPVVRRIVVAVVAICCAGPAAAQPIGPFSWQMQPYCNLVTLTVTPVGATFLLEGFDDQCGAATRASVVGTAFPNPNGTIGLGLTIVATPGGTPVHIDATVTAPAFSGTWRDSVGGAGSFVFGAAAGGAPRPVAIAGPSVTQVVAGSGLTGGGSASTINVGVNFSGSGTASTVAHGDHTHAAPGTRNTAIGDAALLGNASGTDNVAVGFQALVSSTLANGNVAVGSFALSSINAATGGGNVAIGSLAARFATSASANVAIGGQALQALSTGGGNVGIGSAALGSNTTGGGNVAVGDNALATIAGASLRNIGIGYRAGRNATGGNDSIFIGNEGAAADTLTIKIGTDQTRTFIAGVNGGVLDPATDIPVNVDAFGKLGTTASSARFKTDIRDIGDEVSIVQRLRPVSFRYLPLETRGVARQFGLIAEEVAAVMPELVANGADGQPYTVRYQLLAPLLLAEVQRLQRELAASRAELTATRAETAARHDELFRALAELRAQIASQQAAVVSKTAQPR